MKKYCLYKHTNKINGKSYVGITSQKPENRWRNGKGYVNNDYFWRAINKYGWHNFSHEILYTNLSKENAEQLEIQLIAEYKTDDKKFGYNIEHGGNATSKFSDETKRKISEALKGHPCSEETKAKIGKIHRGKKISEEQKELLRCRMYGNTYSSGKTPWNKGRHWTNEEKAKCNGKAVKCVETGIIYRTAHEAGEILNIDFSSICKCARGKIKRAGGYHWIYVEISHE